MKPIRKNIMKKRFESRKTVANLDEIYVVESDPWVSMLVRDKIIFFRCFDAIKMTRYIHDAVLK